MLDLDLIKKASEISDDMIWFAMGSVSVILVILIKEIFDKDKD